VQAALTRHDLRGVSRHDSSSAAIHTIGLCRATPLAPRCSLRRFTDRVFLQPRKQSERIAAGDGGTLAFREEPRRGQVLHALADRLVVLSNRPARVRTLIDIELPRPRHYQMLNSPEAYQYKRQAMEILHQEAMRSFKASGGVNSSTG